MSNYFTKFFLLLILIFNNYVVKKDYNSLVQRKYSYNTPNIKNINISTLYEFMNITKFKNKILFFEPNYHHHECIPGFTKYFIDLGYDVDILLTSNGIDSLSLFRQINKLRLFTFKNLNQIKNNSQILSSIIKKYCFVILGSTDWDKEDIYNELDLFKINNSILVNHDTRFYGIKLHNFYNQNRMWVLGNLSEGLFVNPHYFGDIQLIDKNIEKTRFFITSSFSRNYTDLLKACDKLKKENFVFEIIVTGRYDVLNRTIISKNLTDNFIFKLNSTYSELYKSVIKSDYIIAILDPNIEYDKGYMEYRVSGSIQLSYGFLKPIIIHQGFSKFYFLNSRNSLLFNDSNIYDIMKKSILLTKKEYRKLQKKLYQTKKTVYKTSFNNVKNIYLPKKYLKII